MSRCHDLADCFYVGRTEIHEMYSNFITNLKTFVIFLQSIPLSTTFSLTIWAFVQYLLLYLSCNSSTAAPCAVLSHWLDARCDMTILAPVHGQVPLTGALYRERHEDNACSAVL